MLRNCRALRFLDLQRTNVADISALAHCPRLESLNLVRTKVRFSSLQ